MATRLSDLRRWLGRHGVSGSSPDALLADLHARREDGEFWRGVDEMVGALDDARVSPRLVAGHPRLDHRPLPEGVRGLRAALPREVPARSWLAGLPPVAVAAFLVLGAACTGAADEELCAEAETYGVTSARETYCELVDLVNGAITDEYTRTALFECLADLSVARRAELLDQFAQLDDEALAAALSDLAYSTECDWETAH